MRWIYLSLLSLLAFCPACSARKSGWTKRLDEDKEKEDGFASALSQTKTKQSAGRNKTPNFESMNLMQALGGDFESLDQKELLKVLSDNLDYAIDMLSTPSKRRELYKPEVIKEITSQLPEFVLGMPDVQQILKQLESGEGEGTEELREQIDAGLDMALTAAQQMRQVIQNPEQLPELVGQALDHLGLGEEEKQLMLDMMSDPEAMQESMKLMIEQLQSSDMADDLLKDEDFMNLLADPTQLTNKLTEMMQDPEIQAALNDPETASLLQEMMQDSGKIDAYAEQLGSSKSGRSKSGSKAEQRRTARKRTI